MISIQAYLEHAKSYNQKLKTLERMIIYDRYDKNYPFLVYIVPAIKQEQETLSRFVVRCLTDSQNYCYLLFLDGLRWVHSNLTEDVDNLRYVPIDFAPINLKRKQFRASYVKLTFHILPDDDNIFSRVSPKYKLSLNFEGKSYIKPATDLPDSAGVPKFFRAVL